MVYQTNSVSSEDHELERMIDVTFKVTILIVWTDYRCLLLGVQLGTLVTVA